MDVELSKEQKEYIETVINWTFPGLTFYYRDADLDIDVEQTYPVGKIIKTGFFIDLTSKAQKPCHNVRFIIASAHAACVYKTEMCEAFTKDCNLAVLHPNSFLKILDIYKVGDQKQILMLHIPLRGIDLLQNTTSFNFVIEDKNYDDYFVQMARKSFDEKLKMEPRAILETERWLERTKYPIGIKADNLPFDLIYETNEKAMNLEIAFRKMGEDMDEMNLPLFDAEDDDVAQ